MTDSSGPSERGGRRVPGSRRTPVGVPRTLVSLASPVCGTAFHVRGEVGDKDIQELQRLRVTFSARYLQRAGRLL